MDLAGVPHPGPDNHNAAPTEAIVVARVGPDERPELATMRWWLTPFWAKEMSTKYSMFNAKSETLEKSPAFREPFRKRRCVVPISGFYEWARSNNQKLPYYLTAYDAPGMLLAGIWDRWHNAQTDDVVESFAILTCPANEQLKFVHNRQPVMLSMVDARRWLDHDAPGSDFKKLFEACLPLELNAIPVSTYVNNARNKDARCFEPVGRPVSIAADGPG